MKKNGFVITMQYNDEWLMPIWVRHYSKYFEKSSMYVIDHGSDNNFIDSEINRIYVPRNKGFDELQRLAIVHGIVFSLMKCYDWGVFCDSDELIFLDDFNPNSMEPKSTLFTYGFDVFNVCVDGAKKVYGIFNPSMCKPLIFNHDYPDWSTGFHGVNQDNEPKMSVLMGHIKYTNENIFKKNHLNRLTAYESMSESEKTKGIAQQWNDQNHFDKVMSNAQQTILTGIMVSSLEDIPLEWGMESSGKTVVKNTSDSFVMDLTENFKNLGL